MAIKIKVNEGEKEQGLDYPLLMISSYDNIIIAMARHGEGCVIREGGTGSHVLGDRGAHWNMDLFKPFTGTIELSNK